MAAESEGAGRLVLVLGGARSGKSGFAENYAKKLSPEGRVLYVATALPADGEMIERIKAHQSSRPQSWRTLEEPENLAPAISPQVGDAEVVLIDCVTIWLSNLLLSLLGDPEREEMRDFTPSDEKAALARVDALIELVRETDATFVVVSNEVGLGLVPPYPLGRVYRDLLGRANQRLAKAADIVFYSVAGITLDLKALARDYGIELAGE